MKSLAIAGIALAAAAPAALATGPNTGYGQVCNGSGSTSPQDTVSGYNNPAGSSVPVNVATNGGVGAEIGSECGGGVGRASVSDEGVYLEDYTAGDQIATAVRSAPAGTPEDPDCPTGANSCDTVRLEP